MDIIQNVGVWLCMIAFPLLLAAIAYREIAGVVVRIRCKDWPWLKRFMFRLGIALLVLYGIGMVFVDQLVKTQEARRCDAARGTLAAHAEALNLYRTDVTDSRYPATLQQLVADNVPGWSGPYTAVITTDPWDNQYSYQSDGSSFTISTVHRTPRQYWRTQTTEVITRHSSDTTTWQEYDD